MVEKYTFQMKVICIEKGNSAGSARRYLSCYPPYHSFSGETVIHYICIFVYDHHLKFFFFPVTLSLFPP